MLFSFVKMKMVYNKNKSFFLSQFKKGGRLVRTLMMGGKFLVNHSTKTKNNEFSLLYFHILTAKHDKKDFIRS